MSDEIPGRAGGLKGGPARAAKLSPERRREISMMGGMTTKERHSKNKSPIPVKGWGFK